MSLSNPESLDGWPHHPIRGYQDGLQGELEALHVEFIQLVARHSHRLRSLTIGFGMNGERLNEHLAEDLPLLEQIRVFAGGIPRGLLNKAQALRKVHVTNSPLHFVFTSLSSVQLARLTHLRINKAATITVIREAAARCVSVVSLILDDGRIRHKGSYPDGFKHTPLTGPIEWRSLRNLTVTFDDFPPTVSIRYPPLYGSSDLNKGLDFKPTIAPIFESILTPELTLLEVNVPDSARADENGVYQLAARSTPFEGLLFESHCQVTRLKIDLPRTLSVEALLRSFLFLESLQSLTIGAKYSKGHSGDLYSSSARGWCSQLFCALTLPNGWEPGKLGALCPELTVVEVEGCFAEEGTTIIDF
ncbi:hypothetical protein V5O48_017431, partial [Marasmius crinis-equi]